MLDEYTQLLISKRTVSKSYGFEPSVMPAHLFDFQAFAVQWTLRKGRCAVFFETGLGKSRIQLEFLAQCAARTGRPVLLLTPLSVAWQINKEGRELGYDCRVIQDASGVRAGINICNYDRLDKLDLSVFSAV